MLRSIVIIALFSYCILFDIAPAYSAIYQCTDSDGRTVFSDQPCGGGVNRQLPDFEVKLESSVSGRFTLNTRSFPVRQGIALWEKEDRTLILVLTTQLLSDTQKQQAVDQDWSFFESHKATGLVVLTIALARPELEINAVKTMTVEIHTQTDGEADVYRTILGGDDIIGHINQLKTTRKDKNTWLEFSSQEFKPELRWNINLILPLQG